MSIKIVTENRKARFDYTIIEKFEAGMALMGSEVKSMREGHVQLKDSYVVFTRGEMYLQNAHISEYKPSSYNNHAPERKRKLLMKRHEIDKLEAAVVEKGLTIVPLKIYFSKGIAKVEIALVKGKKVHDKRDSIKDRDVKRELSRASRR
ncbi:MAG TPA: SsrA-binding protein SmpB [Bdellovibrionales bacterium]|nr:SsrA-binding protein SmpB [Bdellovibrionales bacterium]